MAKYETRENIPVTDFYMEVLFRSELFLPEETDTYYAMILFNGCNVSVFGKNSNSVSGSGLLVLSPKHEIKDIKVMGDSKTSFCQTLVFSPYGLNTNFKSFPDSFEYTFLNQLKEGYSFVDLDSKTLETFINYFDNINSHMNVVQGYLWPCFARSYISELIILLTRNMFMSQSRNQCGNSRRNKINMILEYFQYAYNQKITLDDVCRKFATNRTSLNSLFNKTYGMSAIAYLNKMRIQNASMMLTNTAMSICDIAERTGFADESYFSKTYKKMTGKSPSEFRLSIPHPQGRKWPETAL